MASEELRLEPPGLLHMGALKDTVYTTLPTTLDELKRTITEDIEKILSHTCKNVFSNLIKYCEVCKKADGSQLQHLL